jgi:hypothetical protein
MGFLKKMHDKVTAPHGNIELRLDSWAVPLGQSLVGSLNFSAAEDFESTEVRCEIECKETARVIRYNYDPNLRRSVPYEARETSVLYAAKPTLSTHTHFTNGENRSFPINISLPPASRTTSGGIDRQVVWTIKGVVAVDGRPDITTDTAEFQVIQPVIQPTAAATQPQIVKEVVIVKIPCKYCQTLFNQLETFCPNCGAKRTI